MFVSINFYFRPYEFLAVYQPFACVFIMPCSYLTYIRAVRLSQK